MTATQAALKHLEDEQYQCSCGMEICAEQYLPPPHLDTIRQALVNAERVQELERCIAQAAICLLTPNIAIIDTVWINDRTNITLYEHLVSHLDVELIGDIDKDAASLAAFNAGRDEGEG